MKSATIYNYKDLLLFVTNNRYTDGMVRKTTQISVFNESECIEILTQALKKSFDDFETEVALEPDSDKKFKSEISKAVGLKKYNDFLIGSNMIELVDFGEEVKLQPLISVTKFKGYESFHRIIESYSKEELGSHQVVQAILRLFDQMKS
jgi:hypothetical protein